MKKAREAIEQVMDGVDPHKVLGEGYVNPEDDPKNRSKEKVISDSLKAIFSQLGVAVQKLNTEGFKIAAGDLFGVIDETKLVRIFHGDKRYAYMVATLYDLCSRGKLTGRTLMGMRRKVDIE